MDIMEKGVVNHALCFVIVGTVHSRITLAVTSATTCTDVNERHLSVALGASARTVKSIVFIPTMKKNANYDVTIERNFVIQLLVVKRGQSFR